MAEPTKRDEGLSKAIAAAGGITALARLLGLRQPSVSGWRRIPVNRVFQIEAITGLNRRILRPDLFDVPETSHHSNQN